MKMNKRLRCIFLVIVMLLSCVTPISALGAEETSSPAMGDEEVIRTFSYSSANRVTLNGNEYGTIQEAADQARPGDTITVYGGVYRESVVFPRGGADEGSRITLKAADGEEVMITGSEIVPATEWVPQGGNIYQAVISNADYFENESTFDEFFNPFDEWWMSKGSSYSNYYSCGCVYINDKPMLQKWSKEEVDSIPYSWIAEVDNNAGETTIYANFGNNDPSDSVNTTEINARKQCITAKWNQGYITIDGFTVMRGCAPKTIDFWQTAAKPMDGAISTSGGHHWIIENCYVTQNRGVAVDFGNGSRMKEDLNGGEPDLYGYHIIRHNNVSENGTNGMFAYRGPYTEIYGNTLANNNVLNTGLLSEAYIKDVSGGFGIYIHDNYIYSDQPSSYKSKPIWMDCECDGSRISRNIIYCATGAFDYIDIECNVGYLLLDNNIFYGSGLYVRSSSHTYFVNNLYLDIPNNQLSWPGGASWGMKGSEGYTGFQRAMRAAEPGTLNFVGSTETSRFETFNRFNKFLNNIVFERGLDINSTIQTHYTGTVPGENKGTKSGLSEVAEELYDPRIPEVYLNPDDSVNPDYSGGYWANPSLDYPIAWISVDSVNNPAGSGSLTWGNEVDYNFYLGGAGKVNRQYASERSYEADSNSYQDSGGSYHADATPEFFTLTLDIPEGLLKMDAPHITGDYLGNTELYEQWGINYHPPDIDTDFFGNPRDENNTVVGPFANLKLGTNSYQLWPRSGYISAVNSVTVSPDTASVPKGGSQQFEAIVDTDSTARTVVWKVTGADSDDTVIDEDGLLTIGAYETAETLTVVAVSTEDVGKYGAATVTVAPAIAPIVKNAVISGASLTLAFDKPLANKEADKDAFTVSGVTAGNAVASVMVSGSALTLTLDSPAAMTDTVTISYQPTGSNDLTDGVSYVAAFSDYPVTNITGCGSDGVVVAVIVSPLATDIDKGGSEQFTAEVIIIGDAGQEVEWSVTGGASPDTIITSSGLLTIGSDETASSLIVRADSTFDSEKFDTAIVTVIDPDAGTYILTVSAGEGGTARIIGGSTEGKYKPGDRVSITATPNSRYKFVSWTSSVGGGFDNASNAAAIFTMPDEDVTVTASFSYTGGTGSGGGGTSTYGARPASGAAKTSKPKESEVEAEPYIEPTVTELPKPVAVLDKTGLIAYISGYPDGTIRPEGNITRAEAAVIFYKLVTDSNKSDYIHEAGKFSDISEGQWYSEAVRYLAAAGIISGYGDGSFKPDNEITRAEFAAMASGFSEMNLNGNLPFNDVGSEHWAVSYIRSMYNNGWVSGYPDGSFKPDNKITRAEVIVIVNKMTLRDTLLERPGVPPFTDLSEDKWYYNDVMAASSSKQK